MLGASGNRRRYCRWKRTARRIPLVKSSVGTRVLGSVKAAQSRGESGLFVDGAVWEEEDEELCCSGSLLSLFDTELHGGHRMTSHVPAVAGIVVVGLGLGVVGGQW